MTQDLAESVSSFTRTLVHDCDLVPRTCVASLAVLRAQLEAEKDAVYANNTLLSSLKSSGVLEGGVSLLGTVATAALASKVGVSCLYLAVYDLGILRCLQLAVINQAAFKVGPEPIRCASPGVLL